MIKIDALTYSNEENNLLCENVNYGRSRKFEVERFKEINYKVIEENENFVIMKREATENFNYVSLVIISSLNC